MIHWKEIEYMESEDTMVKKTIAVVNKLTGYICTNAYTTAFLESCTPEELELHRRRRMELLMLEISKNHSVEEQSAQGVGDG